MSGNFLLDTNILIAFFKQDPNVLKEISRSSIYVPSLVIGELWFGSEKSSKKKNNQKQILALIEEVTILPVTTETAKHYGLVKNGLKQKGTPIPENDIWISAVTKEYDMTLVTRDAHFFNIESIKISKW